MTDADKPGILVPPPFIYLAFFLVGLAIDLVSPAPFLTASVQYSAGAVFIPISGLIAIMAVREFRKAKTAFDVRKAANALVTSGPFRYSRNPGYVALTVLYLGAALMVDSVWILVMVLPALAVMQQAVIRREEWHLERRFGDEYRQYKETARRWF